MSDYNAADSDIRMLIATQVAYLDGDEGMTVRELLDRIISNYGSADNLGKRESSQLDTARYIRELIEKHDLGECERWKIKSVGDHNSEAGFYGCLIDTRDGNAILGFRGSESFDSGQVRHDWVEADFGLLNNTETRQQELAREFTQQIYEKYGDTYNSYSFTGHSLGGNLAEHALITAPEDMNLHRSVSYDGPGFSDQYIAAHRSAISERSQLIDQYAYSTVGSLLNPLPGSNYMTIRAHNDESTDGIGAYFVRHHTRNIEFDESGMVQEGPPDIFAVIAGPVSRDVENGAPLIMYLLCPQLAALWTIADNASEVVLRLKDAAGNLIEKAGKALSNLKERIEEWFRNTFGVALTGEYEIDIRGVRSLSDELGNVSRDISGIRDIVDGIRTNLKYYSAAGTYYRSKLFLISTGLGNDIRKAAALAEAAGTCAQITSSSDAQAAGYYADIKG